MFAPLVDEVSEHESDLENHRCKDHQDNPTKRGRSVNLDVTTCVDDTTQKGVLVVH